VQAGRAIHPLAKAEGLSGPFCVKAVHIGLDIGQKSDYSAVVVVQVGERPGPQTYRSYRTGDLEHVPESTYKVRHLARLPLGTPFRDVAQEVVNLVGGVWAWEKELRQEGYILPTEPQLTRDLWMDATGMGLPVVEMVKNALAVSAKTDQCLVHPVVFNYGDRYKRGEFEGHGDVLGKGYLVNRLQVLFEQRQLTLPKGDPQTDAMVEELKAYEIRVDENANERYGAFVVGAHDDMVTALGLTCIEDPGYYSVTAGPNLWP
jgi:hypothetical protein